MPARRTVRGLTPEDRALWERIKASAKPLRPVAPAPTPAEVTIPVRPAAHPGVQPPRPPAPRPAAAARPDPAPSAIDRRRFEKLRRGRLEPEARLDLHGMTSERAHAALIRFIGERHAQGLRLVLVITGKGRPADDLSLVPRLQGILRHSVPHWLAAPPLALKVLDVVPAHPRHGGTGALYVYLRRLR
jgi:DNA-nicking Smr family endonuclease